MTLCSDLFPILQEQTHPWHDYQLFVKFIFSAFTIIIYKLRENIV